MPLSRRSTALVLAAVVATQSACFAGVRPVPTPEEPIACSVYHRSLAQDPPHSPAWGWLIAAGGAALAAGGAALLPRGRVQAHPVAALWETAAAYPMMLLGGAAVVGGAGDALAAHADDRAANAARCDAELARVCADVPARACPDALDRACDGGDRGACWALLGADAPGEVEPPRPELRAVDEALRRGER